VLNPVIHHRGLYGVFGVGYIFKSLSIPFISESLVERIFLIGLIVYAFLIRKKSIFEEILLVMLFFFAFTPTFGIQWLIWLVPFLLLTDLRKYKEYMFISSVYLLLNYGQWIGNMTKLTWYPQLVFIMGIGLWIWFLVAFVKYDRKTALRS